MNVSDLWDFTFFWQMFRNFIATAAPFVMVVMAVYVVKLLLSSIMSAVARRKE
ncbi:PTS ascorbate transporter subunit IIC [Paenibacillus sp. FSL M8-0228]|uniref:PTS ascorbate transporter subunit IIC n=1 Tax=Paenibacillus sp. FSL M8-0228 TaxID=2921620 RepID=UPI0030F8202E